MPEVTSSSPFRANRGVCRRARGSFVRAARAERWSRRSSIASESTPTISASCTRSRVKRTHTGPVRTSCRRASPSTGFRASARGRPMHWGARTRTCPRTSRFPIPGNAAIERQQLGAGVLAGGVPGYGFQRGEPDSQPGPAVRDFRTGGRRDPRVPDAPQSAARRAVPRRHRARRAHRELRARGQDAAQRPGSERSIDRAAKCPQLYGPTTSRIRSRRASRGTASWPVVFSSRAYDSFSSSTAPIRPAARESAIGTATSRS